MRYESIVIDEDRGWARFTRPHAEPSHAVNESLELRPGFTLEHVLAAVDATGWVVERDGELRIEGRIGCDRLARAAAEILSYFDGPDMPNPELLALRDQIALRFGDEGVANIPLQAYAWLDLVLREIVAEAARSASALWKQDLLVIDLDKLREERIREFRRRYAPADTSSRSQQMAQSARRRHALHGRENAG
jgi:hypothetical protein